MREPTTVYRLDELESWPRPKREVIKTAFQTRYDNGCAALTSVLTGELGLTKAANDNHLCRKRLRSMVRRASRIAPDGARYGFRVCVPWGAYFKEEDEPGQAQMPRHAGPHAMAAVLACHTELRDLVDAYGYPLPPGRPPKSFDRLHDKMLAYLRKLDLADFYPLNQDDKGRRALLRFIRQRRIDTSPYTGTDEPGEAPTVLSDLLKGRAFDRSEVDAHRIDIEAVLGVSLPNGGIVKRAINTIWLMCEIEVDSKAILAWWVRVGRGYNNLDLSSCIASSLQPWSRRELTIPGLVYHPGGGLPSGLPGNLGAWRVRSAAMDNAKAHHSVDFEASFCRAHGGILVYGRAHEPRSRPVVEQLFSRLEQGALRDLPGGYEPAQRLGDNKIRISNFSPEDLPIQMHLLVELIDVIISNYNATPHPALGTLSPLQFLQLNPPRAFDFTPSTGAKDAVEMNSILLPLDVKGNRDEGVTPHVNYKYVRYRSPELEGRWELIGKKVYARVDRHDLRTLLLMRSATTPMGFVRAASPWDKTRHDETTRTLIKQWCKQPGGLSLVGVDCAINAYVAFLRKLAPTSPKAVDQLARMQQIDPHLQAPAPHQLMQSPVQMPRRGWVSFDHVRDH